MAHEETFTPEVTTTDGQVRLSLPIIDGYLRMSPEAARNAGTKLIQQAEVAEGKKPSHVSCGQCKNPYSIQTNIRCPNDREGDNRG